MPVVRLALLLTLAISASAQTIGSGVTIGNGVSVGSITLAPPVGNSQITATKTGTGGGTISSSPSGISCGATCSASFTNGTVVTLTATPVTNSTFDGWSGACSGTGTCSITLSANVTATATFTDHTTSGLIFTPPGGSYTGMGTQNVSITNTPPVSGSNIFYTTDGTPASEASTLFSSGTTIPVSSNATISALVEKTGSVRQNTQAVLASGGRKLCAPIYQNNPVGNTAYKNGTPFAVCGGGVGSAQPSTWNVSTDGTTMTYSITGTSGAPQILVTLGGSGCDSCTKETQHFKITPVLNTHMENIEVDMWHNDATRNRLHMFGLQCNQQSGTNQWQIDNEQGSWQNTGITDNCPMAAGTTVDVVFEGHWVIGDTGCGDGHSPGVGGGFGCTYYDNLYINGTKHVINLTRENDAFFKPDGVTPAPWSAGCANQKQLDLRPGGTVSNPFTASFSIQQDNVTCSFSTVTTGSASYTF